MNKLDIVNEINRLTAELPTRKKIASIAEHEGLEIAFDELTDNCCQTIKSENYKESKKAIKSLEVIKNFRDYLEEQKSRIDNIENRIAQLRLELTKCQLSLFQEQNNQKIATGIQFEGRELYTGDTFECPDKSFLLIVESETPGNYAIVGSAFCEELLLQYPKNREVLKNTAYLGNVFDDDKLAEFMSKLQEEQDKLKEEEENLNKPEDEEPGEE